MPKPFLDDTLLLEGKEALRIYEAIRECPIIDYHCHLDEARIAQNTPLGDLGALFLGGDHYKWRAMRLCGIEERRITGDAPNKEKFFAYASILPRLIGSPLYLWTHMELKALFGITLPLCAETAQEIWDRANDRLGSLRVRDLLKHFKVEAIMTTDDPMRTLANHGDYDGIKVRPTFRPDACFAAGMAHKELEARLDFFLTKGCTLADHGFDFVNAQDVNLLWLMRACHERGLTLQLHFGTFRNVNTRAFAACGKDSGFDIMRGGIDTDALVRLLDRLYSEDALPRLILYPLNDTYLPPLATLSGAFPGIKVGSAWWFNDTASGIRRQLTACAEYAVLGTHPGMLTDSRSFSSYVRFDFYRRILATWIAKQVDAGEYDKEAAIPLAKNLSYYNAKELMTR